MSIKTKLMIGAVLPLLIGLAILGVIGWKAQESTRISQHKKSVEKITNAVFELILVGHDYHSGGNRPRAAKQWQERHSSLGRLLDGFSHLEQWLHLEKLINQLHHTHKSLGYLFDKMHKVHEQITEKDNNESEELVAILSGQKRTRLLEMLAQVGRLKQAIDKHHQEVEDYAQTYILSFVVGSALLGALLLFIIGQSVIGPIAKLSRGVKIVGEGDLSYKVEGVAKDEIGELSRTFNTMAVNLATTMTSRDKLTKEIKERERVELQLLEKNTFIDNILRYSTDIAIAATDLNYRIQYFNPRAEEVFGYSQKDVVGKTVFQIHEVVNVDPARFDSARANVLERGEHRYETEANLDGDLRTISARMTGIIDADDELTGFVLMAWDITESRRAAVYLEKNELRLSKLLELNRNTSEINEKELCSRALDIAVELTDSVIGYLHMVNEDQETIQLVTWNAAALELCTAVHATHYPISDAGIWADSFRLKKPVVHNDYPNEPNRKGYPEGHFPVYRHMSTPVIEGNQVHMILGVGNKEMPYDEMDVTQLQLVADEVQKFVMRLRAEEALMERARILAENISLREEVEHITRHDLKTPLNAIIGLPDALLEDDNLRPDQRKLINQIQKTGFRMLEQINRSLDLYRMEQGLYELHYESIQLEPLLHLHLCGAPHK
jgi:PAS domain S-box-containing protein